MKNRQRKKNDKKTFIKHSPVLNIPISIRDVMKYYVDIFRNTKGKL